MGLSLPSKEDAAKQVGDFGLLDEDDYIARIDSMVEVNRGGQYAKLDEDGKPLPTIDFFLKPIAFADAPETPLVDQDGEPVNPDKHLIFFYDPHRLGTRPVVSRSRKFLAAATGVGPEDAIDLPGGLTDLIGKDLVVTVSIKDGNNRIVETRPLKKKARDRVRVAAPTPEVEEDDVPF
jgi:hypothetical protein